MPESTLNARLDELLQRCVWDHIQLAEDARAMADVIARHSKHLNDRGWGPAFHFLQVILGNELSLAISRLFDRPKNYPTQSIPAVLAFLEEEGPRLQTVRRRVLESHLTSSAGAASPDWSSLTDAVLTQRLVQRLRSDLPDAKKIDSRTVSDAYSKFQFRRDKEVAHSERVYVGDRLIPAWSEAEPVLQFAKKFLAIVGEGYTDRTYLAQDGSFLSDRSDRHVARNFEWALSEIPVLPNRGGAGGSSASVSQSGR